MDEDIKKEIEELKKEEETQDSQEDEKESPEELAEELGKEEEQGEEPESPGAPPSSKKIFYLKILGIVLALLGIIGGIFFLKSMFTKKKPIVKHSKLKIAEKIAKKEKTAEKPLLVKKPFSISTKGNYEAFAYKTSLSNFLIPLSEKEFLKVDITIFFSKYEEIREFRKRELFYREFFYNFLKRVSPSVWYDTHRLELISKKAIEELKKENITPVPLKVRFDGAILKA